MRDITDYKITAVRASAVLTTSYVAGTVLTQTREYNQLVVLLKITLGSLSSVEVRIETSMDNTTWYQETLETPVSTSELTGNLGDRTYTISGNYEIYKPIACNFIRISVKGTGTVTNSLCTVDAVLART